MATNLRAFVLVIVMELCLIPSTLMGADPAVIQPPPQHGAPFLGCPEYQHPLHQCHDHGGGHRHHTSSLASAGCIRGKPPDEKSRGGNSDENRDCMWGDRPRLYAPQERASQSGAVCPLIYGRPFRNRLGPQCRDSPLAACPSAGISRS